MLYRETPEETAIAVEREWESWRSASDAISCRLVDVDFIPANAAYRDDLTSSASMKVACQLSLSEGIFSPLSFLNFAVRFATATGAEQLYWSPASTLSDVSKLSAGLAKAATGQALPVLNLLDLDFSDPMSISSRGLLPFAGREIRYSIASLGKVETVRRILRVAHDIMREGPYPEDCVVPGMETSENIEIKLSPDGATFDVKSVLPIN